MSAQITMYTTTWCVFCKSLKRALAYYGIELTEVDIEQDPAAAAFVESVNGGNQTVPTLRFADGTTMVNPTAAQVKEYLASIPAPAPAPASAPVPAPQVGARQVKLAAPRTGEDVRACNVLCEVGSI